MASVECLIPQRSRFAYNTPRKANGSVRHNDARDARAIRESAYFGMSRRSFFRTKASKRPFVIDMAKRRIKGIDRKCLFGHRDDTKGRRQVRYCTLQELLIAKSGTETLCCVSRKLRGYLF